MTSLVSLFNNSLLKSLTACDVVTTITATFVVNIPLCIDGKKVDTSCTINDRVIYYLSGLIYRYHYIEYHNSYLFCEFSLICK